MVYLPRWLWHQVACTSSPGTKKECAENTHWFIAEANYVLQATWEPPRPFSEDRLAMIMMNLKKIVKATFLLMVSMRWPVNAWTKSMVHSFSVFWPCCSSVLHHLWHLKKPRPCQTQLEAVLANRAIVQLVPEVHPNLLPARQSHPACLCTVGFVLKDGPYIALKAKAKTSGIHANAVHVNCPPNYLGVPQGSYFRSGEVLDWDANSSIRRWVILHISSRAPVLEARPRCHEVGMNLSLQVDSVDSVDR